MWLESDHFWRGQKPTPTKTQQPKTAGWSVFCCVMFFSGLGSHEIRTPTVGMNFMDFGDGPDLLFTSSLVETGCFPLEGLLNPGKVWSEASRCARAPPTASVGFVSSVNAGREHWHSLWVSPSCTSQILEQPLGQSNWRKRRFPQKAMPWPPKHAVLKWHKGDFGNCLHKDIANIGL